MKNFAKHTLVLISMAIMSIPALAQEVNTTNMLEMSP